MTDGADDGPANEAAGRADEAAGRADDAAGRADDSPESVNESPGTAGDSSESTDSADALEEADVDWEMAPESDATFPDDPERRAFLREIAAEVRGDSSESKQLSAVLYRVSDLYDPEEDTSPEEIYLNVRHIMSIKEQGGLRR